MFGINKYILWSICCRHRSDLNDFICINMVTHDGVSKGSFYSPQYVYIILFLVKFYTVLFFYWSHKAMEWTSACPKPNVSLDTNTFWHTLCFFNLLVLKSLWNLSYFSEVPMALLQLNAVQFAIDDECAWILNDLLIFMLSQYWLRYFLFTPHFHTIICYSHRYSQVTLEYSIVPFLVMPFMLYICCHIKTPLYPLRFCSKSFAKCQ